MHAGVKGAAPQSFLPMNEEGDKESASVYNGGGSMILQRKVEMPEPIARDMSPEQKNQQQAINALEVEEWTKV